MAKEPEKKPPGVGATRPPAAKKPGDAAAAPPAKAPAPKTQLSKQIQQTTVKKPTDQKKVDGTVIRKESTPTTSAPALKQATVTSNGAMKDTTRHPALPKATTATSVGKTTAAPATTEKAASFIGDYKLLKKLGQGGMGAVYKAQNVTTKQIVALKVLSKDLVKKGDFVQRFEREARVMSKLDHPHVLRCFDVGKHKDYHFLTMEYVDGGSVDALLKKFGRFEIGDAMHIILKIARGLEHAHEKNLIHRDIKPENILLTKEGVVKIADLGLAKDTEEDISLTKTGAGAGTPIYMAPEQARDVKHVDGRVDIYAMGVMLYVFLTGQPPFPGTTFVEVISAKEKGTFAPIRRLNADAPPRLDLIVDKMLAKKPEHRYSTCTEVIAALTELRLANPELSFITNTNGDASAQGNQETTMAPGIEPNEQTQVGNKQAAGSTRGPGMSTGSTRGPGMSTGSTRGPGMATGKTSISDQEPVEKDMWYWNMKRPNGKVINKKLTTDQIRMLIKSGGIKADAEISKTAKAGFRAIATYDEFGTMFRVMETMGKAKSKGDKYQKLVQNMDVSERRYQRWRGFKRFCSKIFGTLFGLVWILAILGALAVGGWYLFMRSN